MSTELSYALRYLESVTSAAHFEMNLTLHLTPGTTLMYFSATPDFLALEPQIVFPASVITSEIEEEYRYFSFSAFT